MKCYAGIGSRQTPQEILDLMDRLAQKLESDGWTLRSGGADGADNAFAKNVKNKQIFLPWSNFNNLNSEFIGAPPRAWEIAQQIHPAWDRCSDGAKKLHARNVCQVLGPNVAPKDYSRFVVCWTPNGQDVGGTATAIRLARQVGIKVLNLANKKDLDKILAYLGE